MTYLQQFVLTEDLNFRGRVQMALIKAATDIKAEDPGVVGHIKRAALADIILKGGNYIVFEFLYAIAANPAISLAGPTNSLDGDLDFVIATAWNTKAGI